MIRGFLLGAVAGGLAVWAWRDQIQAFVENRTRTVRTHAADRLHSLEATTERVFDRTATPLRRAEELLDGTKARIGETIRAGEQAIRPGPESESRE